MAHTAGAFGKSAPFFDLVPKLRLTPQYRTSQGPFRVIIRRLYSPPLTEEPKVIKFTAQMAHKLTDLIFTVLMKTDV
ncbi:MAG: hypothetical protein LBU06_01950 [Desulfovibrio sp.]|jgi:hypothetical protein|nr:hypothetical protein [Desulfovibrio sp.]